MTRQKESDQFPINIHRIIRDSGGSRSEALPRLRNDLTCAQTGHPINTYDDVYVVEVNRRKRFVKPQALSDFDRNHTKVRVLSPTEAKRYIIARAELPATVSEKDGTIVPIARQEQLVLA